MNSARVKTCTFLAILIVIATVIVCICGIDIGGKAFAANELLTITIPDNVLPYTGTPDTYVIAGHPTNELFGRMTIGGLPAGDELEASNITLSAVSAPFGADGTNLSGEYVYEVTAIAGYQISTSQQPLTLIISTPISADGFIGYRKSKYFDNTPDVLTYDKVVIIDQTPYDFIMNFVGMLDEDENPVPGFWQPEAADASAAISRGSAFINSLIYWYLFEQTEDGVSAVFDRGKTVIRLCYEDDIETLALTKADGSPYGAEEQKVRKGFLTSDYDDLCNATTGLYQRLVDYIAAIASAETPITSQSYTGTDLKKLFFAEGESLILQNPTTANYVYNDQNGNRIYGNGMNDIDYKVTYTATQSFISANRLFDLKTSETLETSYGDDNPNSFKTTPVAVYYEDAHYTYRQYLTAIALSQLGTSKTDTEIENALTALGVNGNIDGTILTLDVPIIYRGTVISKIYLELAAADNSLLVDNCFLFGTSVIPVNTTQLVYTEYEDVNRAVYTIDIDDFYDSLLQESSFPVSGMPVSKNAVYCTLPILGMLNELKSTEPGFVDTGYIADYIYRIDPIVLTPDDYSVAAFEDPAADFFQKSYNKNADLRFQLTDSENRHAYFEELQLFLNLKFTNLGYEQTDVLEYSATLSVQDFLAEVVAGTDDEGQRLLSRCFTVDMEALFNAICTALTQGAPDTVDVGHAIAALPAAVVENQYYVHNVDGVRTLYSLLSVGKLFFDAEGNLITDKSLISVLSAGIADGSLTVSGSNTVDYDGVTYGVIADSRLVYLKSGELVTEKTDIEAILSWLDINSGAVVNGSFTYSGAEYFVTSEYLFKGDVAVSAYSELSDILALIADDKLPILAEATLNTVPYSLLSLKYYIFGEDGRIITDLTTYSNILAAAGSDESQLTFNAPTYSITYGGSDYILFPTSYLVLRGNDTLIFDMDLLAELLTGIAGGGITIDNDSFTYNGTVYNAYSSPYLLFSQNSLVNGELTGYFQIDVLKNSTYYAYDKSFGTGDFVGVTDIKIASGTGQLVQIKKAELVISLVNESGFITVEYGDDILMGIDKDITNFFDRVYDENNNEINVFTVRYNVEKDVDTIINNKASEGGVNEAVYNAPSGGNNDKTNLIPGSYTIRISGVDIDHDWEATYGDNYELGDLFRSSVYTFIVTEGSINYYIETQTKTYYESDPTLSTVNRLDCTSEIPSNALVLGGIRRSDMNEISLTRAEGENVGSYRYAIIVSSEYGDIYPVANILAKDADWVDVIVPSDACNTLVITKCVDEIEFSSNVMMDFYASAGDIHSGVIDNEVVVSTTASYVSVPYGKAQYAASRSGYILVLYVRYTFDKGVGRVVAEMEWTFDMSGKDVGSYSTDVTLSYIVSGEVVSENGNLNLRLANVSDIVEVTARQIDINFGLNAAETWCPIHYVQNLNDANINVKYCDCNGFGVVLENSGSTVNLSNHTQAAMSGATAEVFDELSGLYASLLGNYAIPQSPTVSVINAGVLPQAYTEFYNKAKDLYGISNRAEIRNVSEGVTNGGLIGINRPFGMVHESNGPAYSVYQTVVARLFGYSDSALFAQYAQNLADTYLLNTEGAGADTVSNRLKYDGVVYSEYTENEGADEVTKGLFILPFAFANELTDPVLALVMLDSDGVMSVWINNIEAAFRVANLQDSKYNTTIINTTTNVEVYGRCVLFEEGRSYCDPIYDDGDYGLLKKEYDGDILQLILISENNQQDGRYYYSGFDMAYGEVFNEITLIGYAVDDNEPILNTRAAGNKILTVASVIMPLGQNSSNYSFTIVPIVGHTPSIEKRIYTITSGYVSGKDKKEYDGEDFNSPLSGSMLNNIVGSTDGEPDHTIGGNAYFSTSSSTVQSSALLSLIGSYRILDENGNDVTGNYQYDAANSDFGSIEIIRRYVQIGVSGVTAEESVLSSTYDDKGRSLDVTDGKFFSLSDESTELNTYTVIKRNPVAYLGSLIEGFGVLEPFSYSIPSSGTINYVRFRFLAEAGFVESTKYVVLLSGIPTAPYTSVSILTGILTESLILTGTDCLYQGKTYTVLAINSTNSINDYCYYSLENAKTLITDASLVASLNDFCVNNVGSLTEGKYFSYNGERYAREEITAKNGYYTCGDDIFFRASQYVHVVNGGDVTENVYTFVNEQAVFSDGDEVSGKVICVQQDVGSTYLMQTNADVGEQYTLKVMNNHASDVSGNYTIDIGNADFDLGLCFRVAYVPRALTITFESETDFNDETIYDGKSFAQGITNVMASGLAPTHTIDETRSSIITNNTIAGTYTVPVDVTIALIISRGATDPTNRLSNYSVTYQDITLTIQQRSVIILLDADATVSTAKNYDKTVLSVPISSVNAANRKEVAVLYTGHTIQRDDGGNYISGLPEGHFISVGTYETADANVYTLDHLGNIIMDGDNYAKKELHLVNGAFSISYASLDVTSNYDIEFATNYGRINPRAVTVDYSKVNSSMTFDYEGKLISRQVQNEMILLASNPNINGLLTSDVLYYAIADGDPDTTVSENFVSTDKNAGTDIGFIPPTDRLFVKNTQNRAVKADLYTENYDIRYLSEYKISILTLKVTLDPRRDTDVYRATKVYDGDIYFISLTNKMITLNGNSGLIDDGIVAHYVTGTLTSADCFVHDEQDIALAYAYRIMDENNGDVTANYEITNTPLTAKILRRPLLVTIPDSMLSKIYDGKTLKVLLTNAMAEVAVVGGELKGLIDGDTMKEDVCSAETYAASSSSYEINTDRFPVEITINNSDTVDVTSCYSIAYTSSGTSSGQKTSAVIGKRNLIITVVNNHGEKVNREADDFVGLRANKFCSGLYSVYDATRFVVDYTYYSGIGYSYDGETYCIVNGTTNFGLAENEIFSAGSRITETDSYGRNVKLVDNVGVVIKNALDIDTQDNYEISYADSYYYIKLRQIKFDVSLGRSDFVNAENCFTHYYDRLLFNIGITASMLCEGTSLPVGQTLTGNLTTADADVHRNVGYNPINVPFVWEVGKELVIRNTALDDVTSNYDVDLENVTTKNFTERFVRYLPRRLIVNFLGSDSMNYYTKNYDGTPFYLQITADMILTIGNTGFAYDLDQNGYHANLDRLMTVDGNTPYVAGASTADALVEYDINGNVKAKPLVVGNGVRIINPDYVEVTSNYEIHYFKDVRESNWGDIEKYLDGEPEPAFDISNYAPDAIITKKALNISFPHDTSGESSLVKYYDGKPMDLTFEYIEGESNPLRLISGTAFESSIVSGKAVRVTGLVTGESIRFAVTTPDVNVGNQKTIRFIESSKEMVIGQMFNYSVVFDTQATSAVILRRPVLIDIYNALPQGETTMISTYTGTYNYVTVDNSMVDAVASYDGKAALPSTAGLPLIAGHNITGNLRSVSYNAGIYDLVAKTAGETDEKWHMLAIMSDELNIYTSNYEIRFVEGRKIEIKKKALTIALPNNGAISRSKIYDGKIFEINLYLQSDIDAASQSDSGFSGCNGGIVTGLITGHYLTSGSIYTLTSDVGTNIEARCSINQIGVRKKRTGDERIDVDVTANYSFTYVTAYLDILQRELTVRGDDDYYKAANGEYYVKLLDKNYIFEPTESDPENSGVCVGDSVHILSYRVKNNTNENSGFSSVTADGEPEDLIIYDVKIDNDNYRIVTVGRVEITALKSLVYSRASYEEQYEVREENSFASGDFITFTVVGQIQIGIPKVSVGANENTRMLFNSTCVVYTYTGTAHSPEYYVIGLNDIPVGHRVQYAKMTQTGTDASVLEHYAIGEYTANLPVEAGLYQMKITQDDLDYPNWTGTNMYIRINPALPTIVFTGTATREYGSIFDIIATANNIAGLSQALDITVTDELQTKTYKVTAEEARTLILDVGSYILYSSYNLSAEGGNDNYLGVESRASYVVTARAVTVTFQEERTFVYSGTERSISVSLNKGGIIEKDKASLSDENIRLTISGEGSVLKNAGDYTLKSTLVNQRGEQLKNYYISNDTVTAKITKKPLTVSALVNGKPTESVSEGKNFTVSIQYDGFVAGEDKNVLNPTAYLPYVPKTAMDSYRITPFGAEGRNYEITYVSAFLTIAAEKQTYLTDAEGLVTVSGEYGLYDQIVASQILADKNNPEYYSIYMKAERAFGGTNVFDDYEPSLAYSMSIKSDDEVRSEGSYGIKIKLSKDLLDKDSYMVICMDNDGNAKLVSASSDGEFISFNSEYVGDFIILTPKSGLSTEMWILMFMAPVIMFLLIITLYIIFRRKY